MRPNSHSQISNITFFDRSALDRRRHSVELCSSSSSDYYILLDIWIFGYLIEYNK